MQLANRPADTPDGVGTILVSRRPFTDTELDTLDRESARLQFDVPFSPRRATDETYVRLTTPEGRAEFLRAYPVNVTAPTDDSPFFFNMLRLRDVVQARAPRFRQAEPQHEGRRDACRAARHGDRF